LHLLFGNSLAHLLFSISLTTKNNGALTMIFASARDAKARTIKPGDEGFAADAFAGAARPLA